MQTRGMEHPYIATNYAVCCRRGASKMRHRGANADLLLRTGRGSTSALWNLPSPSPWPSREHSRLHYNAIQGYLPRIFAHA